jgi:metal-dependent hydrolase (beta-lactamase superfamily II)
MSVFTLEALQAEHGECLLVLWGRRNVPRFLLVDGGPGWDTFVHRLRPRLAELKQRYSGLQPLPLPLVVASHVDDDHIGGLLALLKDLNNGRYDVAKIDCLWHNSFESLAGPGVGRETLKQVVAAAPDLERYVSEEVRTVASQHWAMNKEAHLATASIDQGRELDELADDLKIERNCGFSNGLVVAPLTGAVTRTIDDLDLTVIWPDEERLERLRREWQKGFVTAAAADTSIHNLASIVILAEHAGHRMFLTGDARGDHILTGLERAGVVRAGGVLNVDVLKLQHHGSDRSSGREFFQRVRATHYVISANGRFDNPSEATLQAIVDTQAGRRFQIHLTNCGEVGDALRHRIDDFKRRYPNTFECRKPMDPSIKIELDESID